MNKDIAVDIYDSEALCYAQWNTCYRHHCDLPRSRHADRHVCRCADTTEGTFVSATPLAITYTETEGE